MNTSRSLRSARSRGLLTALLPIAVLAAVLLPHSAMSSPNDGRLVIKRSPLLGYNVAVAIMVDGKPAGTLRHTQTYEKYLTPGSHTVVASASQSATSWQATLDVRAGETYSYTASYNTDKIVLTKAASR